MPHATLMLAMLGLPCLMGQTTSTGSAETTAPCSLAVSDSSNQFTINCQGITQEQGAQFLRILNKIAKDQLDPKVVLAKLDEIPQTVKIITENQAPRRLDEAQKRSLISALSPFPDHPVHVFALFDSESQTLSRDFVEVFREAHWDIREHRFNLRLPPPRDIGIWVGMSDPRQRTAGQLAFEKCVIDTLHLDVRGQRILDAEEGHLYLWIGRRN
jgi:hypothetical protein